MSSHAPILHDMSTSGGDPRDLTAQQLSTLHGQFNQSLFLFAWTFFGFHDLEAGGYRPVHREVCDLLALWGTPDDGTNPAHPGSRLMIQIPRGSYKTSLCTLSNGLWQICRDPETTLLICNETIDRSKGWLRSIRDMVMQNRLFQMVYRDLLPPGIAFDDTRTMPRWWKWSDNQLIFQRSTIVPEASITAAGVGSAVTGGHWTRIIKDDLISEDAKLSPALMERARSWFDSSLPIEQPPYKGIDLVVCTPWTYGDVYRHILEKYDYKLYRRSVLEDHPETGEEYSLLPSKWTVPELHRERERDPYYFSAQMMCSPRAGKEQSFDPDWLRSFTVTNDSEPYIVVDPDHYLPKASTTYTPTGDVEEAPASFPLHWLNRALLVDPASADETAKSRSDHARSGMLVVGIDPWGRRFVLDCWAGKANPDGVIDHIFRLAQRWSLSRVAIEEVTFSVVYQYWLRQAAQLRRYHLSITALKPRGRRKDDRIEQLIPGFQNGFFYFNAGCQAIDALRREYLDYPYAATRDLMDALAYEGDALTKPEEPHPFDPDEPDPAQELDVTGYSMPYF